MNAPGSVILTQWLWQSPVLVTYLVVMAVAIVKWPAYPKPSLLTMAGAGLLLALAVLHTVFQTMMISERANLGMGAREFELTMGAIALVMNSFRVVAIGLLVTAVYSSRTPAAQQEPWTQD
jgi:hypothetical protein